MSMPHLHLNQRHPQRQPRPAAFRPSADTSRLHRFALMALGAELDDDTLTFRDSFGTLNFGPHPLGLISESSDVIRTQTALRTAIARQSALNAEGLISGEVLSIFGPLTFRISLVRESLVREARKTSLLLSLSREGPFLHSGMQLERLAISAYERPGYHFESNRGVNRLAADGQIGYSFELPPVLATQLRGAEQAALSALLSPAARHHAHEDEAERRLITARQAEVAARTSVQQIEDELAALKGETHTRGA